MSPFAPPSSATRIERIANESTACSLATAIRLDTPALLRVVTARKVERWLSEAGSSREECNRLLQTVAERVREMSRATPPAVAAKARAVGGSAHCTRASSVVISAAAWGWSGPAAARGTGRGGVSGGGHVGDLGGWSGGERSVGCALARGESWAVLLAPPPQALPPQALPLAFSAAASAMLLLLLLADLLLPAARLKHLKLVEALRGRTGGEAGEGGGG